MDPIEAAQAYEDLHVPAVFQQWAPLVQWLEPDEPAIWPEEAVALAAAPKNYSLPV